MRNLLLCLVVIGGLTACTQQERQDVLTDVGTHIGADPGEDGIFQYDEVAGQLAVESGQRATNIPELLLFLGGTVAVGVIGWVKRKFLLKTYQNVKTKIVKKPE